MSYTLVVSKVQLETFQKGLALLPENDVVEEVFGFPQTVAQLSELIDLTTDCEESDNDIHSFVL